MTSTTSSLPYSQLAAGLTGTLTTPQDAGYDHARAAWNLAVDQRPLAVVHAASVGDVVATVRFAAAHGVRVAPQATGHGAGALGPVDDAILLRTDRMRDVSVDASQRTARIAAGAQWNDVLALTAPHGLAPLAGSAGDVGVIGFHLGGGLSFLSRRHGMAARHLRRATLVLSDGSIREVDAATEPELLWALRGGSGALGVVVEIEIALHPVPELCTGQLFWPIDRAPEVFRTWRDWTQTAPESITTSIRMLRFPPDPALPEPLRGGAFVVVDGAFLGPDETLDEIIQPLRDLAPVIDQFGPSTIDQLTQLHMDPPVPVPVVSGHALLEAAPDELLDRLIALAGADSGTALMIVELRQLGGAIARGGDGVGVVDGLDAAFAMFAAGVPGGPAPLEHLEAELETVVAAVAGHATGQTFANFVEQPAADAALPASTHQRLTAIIGELDPEGLLLAAHAPA